VEKINKKFYIIPFFPFKISLSVHTFQISKTQNPQNPYPLKHAKNTSTHFVEPAKFIIATRLNYSHEHFGASNLDEMDKIEFRSPLFAHHSSILLPKLG
jgi:hypothetical protein